MGSGPKPDLQRRRQAARLRAGGLSLRLVGQALGISKQGAAHLLRPPARRSRLRGFACAGCRAWVESAGFHGRNADGALCRRCLARRAAPLGVRLRSLRLAAGLTRADLARRAGVDDTTVSACERGPRRPWARTVQRLAEALGVPLDELVLPDDLEGLPPPRPPRKPAGGESPAGGKGNKGKGK
jgi:DNA-binding XRE family transcriptional regulator